MRHRIRVACWFGASAALAAFAACSGTGEPSAEPDAAALAPSAPPTGSTPGPVPLADAADSAAPRDATADDATLDASDSAAVADAMDAADGYDGAPLPGPVETVADIPGLTDFDFGGSHLVYRTPDFKHCTLPSCTDETPLLGPPLLVPPARIEEAGWTVGEDERLHFIYRYHVGGAMGGQDILSNGSVLFDNSGGTYSEITRTGAFSGASVVAYHGGSVGVIIAAWSGRCLSAGGCSDYLFNFGGGIHTGRVARATGIYHTNIGGAVASYTPAHNPPPDGAPVPAAFNGVPAPIPTTRPTLVAVSANGPTVPHPTVVVLRDGNVEACPLANPCLAWLNLGALGTILNLDDQHLYIGTPTGLSRCALAEIGTAGTCTLVPHGPVEAVEEPLYLTTTHAWYRSGTQVRRVLK